MSKEKDLEKIEAYWTDLSRKGCVDAFSCALRETWETATKVAKAATNTAGAVPRDDAKDIAIACLEDVVSHFDDFNSACASRYEKERQENGENEASYWKHQQRVLARMKVQATAALAGLRSNQEKG